MLKLAIVIQTQIKQDKCYVRSDLKFKKKRQMSRNVARRVWNEAMKRWPGAPLTLGDWAPGKEVGGLLPGTTFQTQRLQQAAVGATLPSLPSRQGGLCPAKAGEAPPIPSPGPLAKPPTQVLHTEAAPARQPLIARPCWGPERAVEPMCGLAAPEAALRDRQPL